MNMAGKKKKKTSKKKQAPAKRIKKQNIPIEIEAEKRMAIEGPEETKKLEAPPIAIPPKDKNHNIKIVLGVLVVVAALAVGAYILLQTPDVKLETGTEINGATFVDILTKSNDVYVVMDVRGTKDHRIRRNIMQCGTDLTGSLALATGKIATPYSFDEKSCVTSEGTTTISSCVKNLKNGTTLYVHLGTKTKFYSKMMKIGIGSNYTEGGCNILSK